MSGSAPSAVPTWATDAGTTVEPTSGKKAAGWVVAEKPPARWFNYWMNLVYQWIFYYGSKNAAGGVVGLHDTNLSASWTAASGVGLTVVGGGSSAAAAFTGGTSATTGGAGVAATGGAGTTNGNGGNGGTFVGGLRAGSGTSGHGVHATAGVNGAENNSNAGVYGTTTGGGYGIHGVSSGTSYAVFGAGSGAAGGGKFTTSAASGGSYALYAENTGGGRGLIVIADTTSPSRAALRIVPQNAEPLGDGGFQNEIGDMYVTSAGVLKICTVAGTPGTWVSVGAQT